MYISIHIHTYLHAHITTPSPLEYIIISGWEQDLEGQGFGTSALMREER